MSTRLVDCVAAALGHAYREGSAPPPQTIFSTVLAMVPVFGNASQHVAEASTELKNAQTGRLNVVAVCTVVALLAGTAKEAWSAEHHAAAASLCACLIDVAAAADSTEEEVDCTAVCAAKLYPDRGTAPVIDAAVESLQTRSGDTKFPVGAATVVVAAIVHVAVTEALDSDWGKVVRSAVIRAALDCVATPHGGTVVPAVTRKVLIPLLRVEDDATRNETFDRVVSLAESFHKSGSHSEAIVLIASLFDFLFPASDAAQEPARDLRKSDFLWALLSEAIESSGPRVDAAGGTSKVAQLHLQAVYLLKRIVSYTWDAPSGRQLSDVFHASFPWHGKESDAAWTSFFLIFDTLCEYGLHLVSPALERIPQLAEAAAGKGGNSVPAISMVWVERLLDKAVCHANSGVRKLALGCIWSAPQPLIAQQLTQRFICVAAYLAGCDMRLCAEPDKVVLPGSFLDCKAFQGKPAHDIPVIQPVVERLIAFYTQYFGALPSDDERREACATLLRGLVGVNLSRFGVTVTVRLFQSLGRVSSLRKSVLSPAALSSLHLLVTDAIQDKHAYWLEARIDAGLVDILGTLATEELVKLPVFRTLLTIICRGGMTGGNALSAVDITGVAGAIGTGLPHGMLLERVGALSESNAALAQFVDSAQLTADSVTAFIKRGVPNAAEAKELVCVLRAADSRDAIHEAWRAAAGVGERTAMHPSNMLATLLLFAEVAAVQATDGSAAGRDAPVPPAQILASVLSIAVASLNAATEEVDDEDMTERLEDATWLTMRVDHFDILCAAAYECVRRMTPSEVQNSAVFQVLDDVTALCDRLLAHRRLGQYSEHARAAVLRNAMRLAHAMVSPSVLSSEQTAHGLDTWTPYATVARVEHLFARKRLRMTALDVPTPLASTGWGTVLAQYERCSLQLAVALIDSMLVSQPLSQEFVKSIGEFGCDMLDACSLPNVSTTFDLIAIASRLADAELDETVGQWLQAMHNRFNDEMIRRDGHRCQAILAFTLTNNVAAEVSDEIIEALVSDVETTDRVMCYLTAAMAAQSIARPEVYQARFADRLLHIAVIRDHSTNEEEMLAALAVSEPCVSAAHWQPLRRARPATIVSGEVARAAAVSAVLYRASEDKQEALRLVELLLRWNVEQEDVIKQPCMPDSVTHRCRIRLWQLLCALTPLLGEAEWRAVLPRVVNETMEIINMGSVRRYIELFLMRALAVCPAEYTRVRDRLADTDLRAQICSSHTLVALHALKRFGLEGEHGAAMRKELIPALVRLCASNYHIIRLLAQIGLHDLAQDARWAELMPAEAHAIVHLVTTNTEAQKFRERYLDVVVFDEDEALAPRATFSTQRKEGENWLHDAISPLVFDRVSFFHDELQAMLGVNSAFEHHRAVQLLTAGFNAGKALGKLRHLRLVPHGRTADDEYLDFGREVLTQAEEAKAIKGNSETDNLQRKVTSWWNSEVHNELHPRALGTRKRQQLVVVASLVEYPVNIAGLCRCAEIFAIEKVVVPDRKVFANQQFVAVARSAELWMPWEEVPKPSLATYLGTMRQLGYTIIGVEQTADSVPMQSYAFPERTVVVLGAEGTGIPANILPCLDRCVEIPQFGLIRSLNVHVTGAMAMYEFTRQHLMEGAIGAETAEA